MILIVCTKCSSALRVAGVFDEASYLVGEDSEWYPSSYPCWNDCGGLAEFTERFDLEALQRLHVHDLTPQEAFLALQGMGLPKERDCSAAAVQQLFKEVDVKSVETEQIRGSHRCILTSIEMADGSRVHLASSPEGAVVYRISRLHFYEESCKEASTTRRA